MYTDSRTSSFEDIIYWSFLKNYSLFHIMGTEAFEAPWNMQVLLTTRRSFLLSNPSLESFQDELYNTTVTIQVIFFTTSCKTKQKRDWSKKMYMAFCSDLQKGLFTNFSSVELSGMWPQSKKAGKEEQPLPTLWLRVYMASSTCCKQSYSAINPSPYKSFLDVTARKNCAKIIFTFTLRSHTIVRVVEIRISISTH